MYFCQKKKMTSLSVNVNKIATLRNARGGDMPNIVQTAKIWRASGHKGLPSTHALMSATFGIKTLMI